MRWQRRRGKRRREEERGGVCAERSARWKK